VRRPPATAAIELAAVFRHLPTPYLVMTPDLVIVEANEAYLDTVGRSREELVGTPVFEAFPPTPDALGDDGVPRVQVSFERARDTGRADRMPLQKYDIPDPVNGGLVERFWSLTSVPILDDEGRTVLIVQRAEDVTEYVHQHSDPADGVPLGRPGRLDESLRIEGGSLQQRYDALEADLVARAHELAAAIDSRELAARRLAGLAELALRLGGAEQVADVARILDRQQLAVVGAAAAAVVVPGSDGGWDVPLSTDLAEVTGATHRHIPPTSSMPAPWVARTGQRLLLLTAEEGRAWNEGMADVHETTGMIAWAFLPLRARASVLGCLAIGWVDTPDLSADEVELLEGFAAQLAQTLDRIRATEAEASANREVRRLSETLQRSLLRKPALPPTLDVAVRYVPAAEHAHVGGDWYDAFVTTSGTTMVAIGDVTGHDGTAAATMAQIRSLLRGLAYDGDDTPAVLLTRLDRALHGLQLDTLATAVLAQVEDVPDPTSPTGRRCRLRWSNAGHLAPLLRSGDGTVTTLDGDPDLLLGLDPTTGRRDHAVDLDAGCTLVLHTDGLIERRTAGLQQGMDLVRGALAGHGDADPETLCDKLLASVAPHRNEDDIALLVLRLTDASDC
jgi:serine phosphatase RsbU (regulator of sigma subunit)